MDNFAYRLFAQFGFNRFYTPRPPDFCENIIINFVNNKILVLVHKMRH